MSDDLKGALLMFVFLLCFVICACELVYVDKHDVLSSVPLLTVPYWIWLIRYQHRGALPFPFHRVWFNDYRAATPHTYYCQQCGRKAVYQREVSGSIKFDMYSGKSKDERTYSYMYACPQHGIMDVFKEKEDLYENAAVDDIPAAIRNIAKMFSGEDNAD